MKAKKKKAKNKKKPRGRVHSSIDRLPLWLYKAITGMLKDNEWPADFGDHWGGAPRYIDTVNYCKSKGYTVSLSAIGRYAKRGKALTHQTKASLQAERGQDYMLYMIAEECQNFCNVVFDLQRCEIHPDDVPNAKEAIPQIRKQAKEKLAFIHRAIEDLESMEAGRVEQKSTERTERSGEPAVLRSK